LFLIFLSFLTNKRVHIVSHKTSSSSVKQKTAILE